MRSTHTSLGSDAPDTVFRHTLSPVHTSDNVAKNRDIVAETGNIVFLATMLPDCCRFRRHCRRFRRHCRSFWRQCRWCGRDFRHTGDPSRPSSSRKVPTRKSSNIIASYASNAAHRTVTSSCERRVVFLWLF